VSQMAFPNNSVTCVSPWYELRIDADGSLTYCHAARLKEKSNLKLDKWFDSGEMISKVRDQMYHGHSVEGCVECYKAERNKFVSFRHRRNLEGAIYEGEYFQESLKQSPAYNRMVGKESNIKPSFLHVSLSNLCNLSCRMCSPMFSSQLSANMKKINKLEKNIPTHHDWTTGPRWQEFCQLVFDNPNLICLHFMGGEPLFHKKFYEFVDLCIEKKFTDFYLTFVTNGTIYDLDLFNKLKKFKFVAIEISIENFHISNDYTRINSDYQKIKNNIISALTHRSDTFDVVLRSVPQALTVQHYHTLIDFALEHDLCIDSNQLIGKEFLKISTLPDNIKKNIVDDLIKRYSYLLDRTELDPAKKTINVRNNFEIPDQITENIRMIIKLLQEPVQHQEHDRLIKDFIKYNQEFDPISPLKFLDVYPELATLYHEYYTD